MGHWDHIYTSCEPMRLCYFNISLRYTSRNIYLSQTPLLRRIYLSDTHTHTHTHTHLSNRDTALWIPLCPCLYNLKEIWHAHKQPSDTDISLAYRAHVKDSAKELYDTRAKTTAAQMSDSTLCDPKWNIPRGYTYFEILAWLSFLCVHKYDTPSVHTNGLYAIQKETPGNSTVHASIPEYDSIPATKDDTQAKVSMLSS
jgi:hypothetical protein